MIFGHAGGDVGVVVLHADQLNTFGLPLECPFGGEVIGVKVVGDDFGLHLEDALQVLDGFFEEACSFPDFPDRRCAG